MANLLPFTYGTGQVVTFADLFGHREPVGILGFEGGCIRDAMRNTKSSESG
jgi:hypothetical protein